jgi:hypothetical protein
LGDYQPAIFLASRSTRRRQQKNVCVDDHRLTTETPSTNGDKGGQSQAKRIVFIDLFESYLRSGRRVLSASNGDNQRVSVSVVASPRNQFHIPDLKAALVERPFGFCRQRQDAGQMAVRICGRRLRP